MEIAKRLLAAKLLSFSACVGLASALVFAQGNDSAGIGERARAIHDSAIVVDTHADTPQRFLDENFDIGSTDAKDIGHISLDKARAGNLGAEFRRSYRVVMITARAEPGLEAKATAAGAVCLLRKPFELSSLIGCLESALRSR